ncbi:MAG: hypothetical protein Q8R47_02625 [Nanoarchaeota archaeon]|nr:hypothetical protein [Nanoarchaeota archaeon]
MKITAMLVIVLLLFSSFIITGCIEQQEISESPPVSGPSDEEVLAQYPDDLDAALEELEMVEYTKRN